MAVNSNIEVVLTDESESHCFKLIFRAAPAPGFDPVPFEVLLHTTKPSISSASWPRSFPTTCTRPAQSCFASREKNWVHELPGRRTDRYRLLSRCPRCREPKTARRRIAGCRLRSDEPRRMFASRPLRAGVESCRTEAFPFFPDRLIKDRPSAKNCLAQARFVPCILDSDLGPFLRTRELRRVMITTLARREMIAIRDQLTVLQNVLAADRLDMIAPSVAKIEVCLERLESIEYLFSPAC